MSEADGVVEFNELDLEMVMNQALRDFLTRMAYKGKVRHCVDGRYMVAFFTSVCGYNIQFSPPPNDLLALVRQPHETTPAALATWPEVVFWTEKLTELSFDEAVYAMLRSELGLAAVASATLR
jgi:hypothetical protein